MSIRDDMLAAAGRGATSLGGHADALAAYLHNRQSGGAFLDRAGRPDLYYTIFGLEALLALGEPLDTDELAAWLDTLDTHQLDLVHACGVARIWADLPGCNIPPPTRDALLDIIARHRSRDGGFAGWPDSPHAGAYGSFLALSALQDLDAVDAIPDDLADAVNMLRCDAGGFPGAPQGPATTPTTAAAIVTLAQLRRPIHNTDVDWLLARLDRDGGFHPSDLVAEADLLSTAVALFALQHADQPLTARAVEQSRRFVMSLQNPDGGFRASPAATTADCEYSFYALLALGCLETPA